MSELWYRVLFQAKGQRVCAKLFPSLSIVFWGPSAIATADTLQNTSPEETAAMRDCC